MDDTRRHVLRQILGGATALGLTTLAGCDRGTQQPKKITTAACGSNPQNLFYVICHGMMLFELRIPPAGSTAPGEMVVHIPLVPPEALSGGGTDPGHVYKAGSRSNERDLDDLAPPGTTVVSQPHLYTLEAAGAAGNPQNIPPDKTSNIVLYPQHGVSLSGGQQPLIRVTMPLPSLYMGWRSAYVRERILLNSSNPTQQVLPGTFFETHIFVYPASTNQPVLKGSSGTQVWPRPNQSGRKLHIFAGPEQPGSNQSNHSKYLNKLFSRALDIDIPLAQEVCTYEAPLFGPLAAFCRSELIDLNEDSQAPSKDMCMGGGGQVTSLHPTNCKSYFYIG